MMDTWCNVSHVSKFKKKEKKEKELRKKEKRIKKNVKREGEGTDGGGESDKRERGRKFFFSLLFEIYGNRTIGFRWSKRQSRSTHRELCVGTKILEFRQTPRGREFSYLGYF